jgi:hypothetical protein
VKSLAENTPGVLYPWEQIYAAAAACARSDYPMLAMHLGIPLESVDFSVEGIFDPRGEFEGLAGYQAPVDARSNTTWSLARCAGSRRRTSS